MVLVDKILHNSDKDSISDLSLYFLKRLEKNDEFKNRSEKIDQKMENIKKKINQLEKDLENLTILENKFKQKS